jgi:hypothetical protein
MTGMEENLGDGAEMASVGAVSRDGGLGEAVAGLEGADPLAIFLSDPESHLSDILYLYFLIYKKEVALEFHAGGPR